MKFNKILIAGFAVAGLALSPLSAIAQDAKDDAKKDAPATPQIATNPATTVKPEDNWLKICEPLESGEKACIMRQVVLNNGQFFGSFMLRNDPGQESRLLAVAAVPLGVLLPFNMVWQIDGGKPIRVPFVLCDKISCTSQLVINENYINSLKKGGKLTLAAKTQQNKDLVININLAGFTSVYDSDSALTFDQFRKQSSGENALEQQLQDRAEQIRQEKDKKETTPTQ